MNWFDFYFQIIDKIFWDIVYILLLIGIIIIVYFVLKIYLNKYILSNSFKRMEELNKEYINNIKEMEEKVEDIKELKEDIDKGLKRIRNVISDFENDVKEDFEDSIADLKECVDEIKSKSKSEDELRSNIQKLKNDIDKLKSSIIGYINSQYTIIFDENIPESEKNSRRDELNKFIKILKHNDIDIEIIEPHQGDELDPTKHEIVDKITSELGKDKIVKCQSVGYCLFGEIIEKAKVVVSIESDEVGEKQK